MFTLEEVRKTFSDWAPRYDATHAWRLLKRREARLAIGIRPGDRVLEVACGTGLNFPHLRQLVGEAGQLVGVDLTPAMLDIAQRLILRYGWTNVEVHEADAARLPFASRTFDAVLTTHVLHLIGPWREALREFNRVLKPGGVYINTGNNRREYAASQRLRDYWRSCVESHGGQWRRPGSQRPEDIVAELTTLSTSFEEVELLRYTTTNAPREVLDLIQQRAMSDAWQVPDDIAELAYRETHEWAEREYGSLDQPITDERFFVVQIARFD